MIAKKQRLDQILFNRNLAESKTKAQAMIMAGQVFVDGKPISKSGFNINKFTFSIAKTSSRWKSFSVVKISFLFDFNWANCSLITCISLSVKWWWSGNLQWEKFTLFSSIKDNSEEGFAIPVINRTWYFFHFAWND